MSEKQVKMPIQAGVLVRIGRRNFVRHNGMTYTEGQTLRVPEAIAAGWCESNAGNGMRPIAERLEG